MVREGEDKDMVVVASAQAFRPTYLPAGVAELDAALADVDGDNFTRPAMR